MFTFKYQFRGYESARLSQAPKTIEMTLDTEEATLDELCEFFGDFLKACTYHYDGHVGIVEGESILDQELQRDLESLADEQLNDPQFNDNVDTTGYDPVSDTPEEVQTEFNFGDKI